MKVNENGALITPNTGVNKTNSGSNSTSVNPGANKVARSEEHTSELQSH